MRVLLVTNLIYAFVLPIIEIFVGAYIMRSSNDPTIVAIYQLTVYTGIPITFLINGFLLSHIKISKSVPAHVKRNDADVIACD